ncbi:hypothetical protein ACFW2T_11650 [Streptomyces sp. NPDC058892]|uniref:hypothetical protein n=1 Tax=unclassified Streptomyces TaxID=2593676 RepID=UPI0036CC2B07
MGRVPLAEQDRGVVAQLVTGAAERPEGEERTALAAARCGPAGLLGRGASSLGRPDGRI